MRVHAAGITDIGMVRQENQDSFTVQCAEPLETGATLLAVVADGVGGGKAGNVASAIAVETLKGLFLEGAWDEGEAMAAGIVEANRRILERSRQDELCRGMATTCTALFISGGTAVLGHVGDSRAYRIRGGEIEQLTEDHTVPRRLFREGLISEEEVDRHPQSNVLTNAVGSRERVEVDLLPSDVRASDTFVLCSDGMHKYFSKEEIREMAGAAGVERCAESFVAAARERGGDDNITVVVVRAAGDDLGKTTEITSIYEEPEEPPGMTRRWGVYFLFMIIAGIAAYVVQRYH